MANIKQNSLFAAEDWKVVYTAFSNVSLTAYDFDTIYHALYNYIKTNNPDEFNNYVTHTEMMAHVNMLAYLGQSLAFRVDLNSRENFFDTAERRESILQLAYSLSYTASRNQAANGLVKIVSLTTTQPIMDGQGNSLSGREIQWNQANDTNWYDSFVRIMNSTLIATNKFGDPIKNHEFENIRSELYSINVAAGGAIVHPFSSVVNGKSYNFELVGSDITSTGYNEIHPSPNRPFNILYRNDSNGVASANTGFFMQFKEGSLGFEDFKYTNPIPNRKELIDYTNINNTDVWVSEINSDGDTIHEWNNVPSIAGQSVIYNSLASNIRKIFYVKSEEQNKVSIVYPDGIYGDVPKGDMRVWYRTSQNESYIIRPNDMKNKSKTFTYVGHDNQEYQLTVKFSLMSEVGNAATAETNEDIARNAPLLHYTQDRMVNGEDYNIYPPTQSPNIKKLKSVNRTYAGHSRYVNATDPTGSISNITVLGDDGYIYSEKYNITMTTDIDFNTNYDALVYSSIEKMINSPYTHLFFNSTVRTTLLSESHENRGGVGATGLTFTPNRLIWRTLPNKAEGSTGYIYDTINNEIFEVGTAGSGRDAHILRQFSQVKFGDGNGNEKWANIKTIENNGIVSLAFETEGSISLTSTIRNGWKLIEAIPHIRGELRESEASFIEDELANNRSFGLRYDIYLDEWILIAQDNIYTTTDVFDLNAPTTPNSPDNRWLVKAMLVNDSGNVRYEFTTRGMRYVFGSDKDVKFFFNNFKRSIDSETGMVAQDFIKVLDSNTDRVNAEDTSIGNARAVVGRFKTGTSHSATSEYDITLMCPYGSHSDIKLHRDGDMSELTHVKYQDGNSVLVKITDARATADSFVYVSNQTTVLSGAVSSPKLKRNYMFSIQSEYIRANGQIDSSKAVIIPFDSDQDGVYDYPIAFEDIVAPDEYFFMRSYTDEFGYFYDRVEHNVSLLKFDTNIVDGSVYYCPEDVIINDVNAQQISYAAGSFYIGVSDVLGVSQNKAVMFNEELHGAKYIAVVGRSFTSDQPFMFEWKHYAPSDNRIDPSITNVIANYVLTTEYDNSVRSWLRGAREAGTFPEPPTTNSVRNTIGAIERKKMISDQIVYIPAKYKLLFGSESLPQHQASFKVIKTVGSLVTDNEIKSKILTAINEFFNIDNWNFGDGFYFSRLDNYIQQALAGTIASVVIVPRYSDSVFGDLFEIKAEPNELFLSTCSVDDIEIVKSYTNINMRKS